jgi:transcriptional regulator with XRE-family HTH domain
MTVWSVRIKIAGPGNGEVILDNMKVSNCLKKCRKEKQATLQDVGEATLTDATTIWRYENDRRTPTLEMALRLSAYYGKPVNELFSLRKEL